MKPAQTETDTAYPSILIVRLSAFGDVIHTLPALDALRTLFPRGRISWITEELSGSVLAGHPDLADVWMLPRKTWQKQLLKPANCMSTLAQAAGFFKTLRRERFSLAIDFQGNLRSSIVAKLSGAKEILGYHRENCREYSHLFYTRSAPPLPKHLHRIERNLHLPRVLGFNGTRPVPRLAALEAERKQARAALKEKRRPVLLFHPGVSAFGAFKSWTEEGFARLAESAVTELQAEVLFSASGGHHELVERILGKTAGRLRDRLHKAPSCSTLREMAGLVAEVDLVVAPDTGILQLADTLKTPIVGLFGPKDPAIYRPVYAPCTIVTSDVPCRPCGRRSCSHRSCMLKITPEMVFEAVDKQLKETFHGSR